MNTTYPPLWSLWSCPYLRARLGEAHSGGQPEGAAKLSQEDRKFEGREMEGNGARVTSFLAFVVLANMLVV